MSEEEKILKKFWKGKTIEHSEEQESLWPTTSDIMKILGNAPYKIGKKKSECVF